MHTRDARARFAAGPQYDGEAAHDVYGAGATDALYTSPDAGVPWTAVCGAGITLSAQTIAEIERLLATTWQNLTAFYAQAGGLITTTYEAQYFAAEALMDRSTYNGVKVQYPAEAVALCESLLANVVPDRGAVGNTVTLLDTHQRGNALATPLRTTMTGTGRTLGTIEDKTRALLRRSYQQVLLAEQARNEAELRYTQAEAALKAESFGAARENLQRSQAKFRDTLAIQESQSLRATTDQRLTALDARITREEAEALIREVRQLKNQGRHAYYGGDFERAEQALLRAQSRWGEAHLEEDEEITYLLALVGAALASQKSRVIPATAPLYPEMSRLLSLSAGNYDRGALLITQQRRNDALPLLNDAKKYLTELRLVYRYNATAGILLLKIEQLLDAGAFNTLFAKRMMEARDMYRDPAQQIDVYHDLLNLASLNPRYPGLQELITEVEVGLGIRPRPVTAADIRNAADHRQRAQRIINTSGQNEIALSEALVIANEAIRLNPNDEASMLLKDRILFMLGGGQTAVLVSTDESLYQKAVQELQRGNIIAAKALSDQLLQSGDNKRSYKVLELQKKVNSLL